MTGEALVFEVRKRRAAVEETLDRIGADAAIVASQGNFQYLSGYQTPSWANRARPMLLVCDAHRRWHAVVSAAEAEQIEALCPDTEPAPYLEPRRNHSGELEFATTAVETAARLASPARRIGIEWSSYFLSSLAPSALELLVRATGGERVDLSPLLWRMRRTKSAFEIARIRLAAAALDRAYTAFAARAEPGMTERDLHRLFLACAGGSGADWIGYVLVVAGADRPLLGGPTDRSWSERDVLLLDAGLVVDGYWSDFWRLFASGEGTRQHAALYASVVEALELERGAIAPGVPASEVARRLESRLGAHQTGSYGRFGHGVGLDLTEPPSLHRDDETVLEVGMTLCIEPTVRGDDGRTLVGEEMVVVVDDGCELISPRFPSTFRVLSASDRRSGGT